VRVIFRIAIWTLAIVGLALFVAHLGQRELLQVALNRAVDSYRKDLVYRLWAAERGGVYVLKDAKTPPNPYLHGVPDREMVGSNGKEYTLVNPAYLTRMVQELGARDYGLKAHITSLNPLRPENSPDPWERKALEHFQRGETTYWEKLDTEGRTFLRFMGAFKVEADCLKCHAQQGYRVGDLRGGISVTVPIDGDGFQLLGGRRAWLFGLFGFLALIYVGGIVVLTLSDRRERRLTLIKEAAEREQEALAQQLEHIQRLESIGRLAGGVSHDMNNVLSAILATTEMMKQAAPLGSEVARKADLLTRAALRGRDLVKKLTDFSRREVQDPALLDLNLLVKREAELLEHTTFKRIQLSLTLDEALLPVYGEESALSNVLMNLCVNACDAMPTGGELRLETRHGQREGWSEILVTDTGEGMAPEVMARAMEPFYTTKPLGKGTGLGLSVVYGTVRAHGGTVEIQSKLGEGTTVILGFPGRPKQEDVPPLASPIVGKELAPRHILFVDDDPFVSKATIPLIRSLGHWVEGVASGGAALERLGTGLPLDLVMLDSNMPGLTGLETLRLIREMRPELPVIFSSGYLDEDAETQIRAYGKVCFLGKPYVLAELKRILGNLDQR